MSTYDYKKLEVWQRSMKFVVAVYSVCEKLPDYEKYSLADQLRRASVSIPSNIAEGQKRANKKETVQFTYVAISSLAEVETQLILASRLHGVKTDDLLTECEIIGRMLTALTNSLKRIK
ncbi:four helix bundle protein [Candidatus Saccharibacteria bacterium]|nr:four helix bundle protein [Candidatus Saccharibacteria bacterium]MCB9821329.1 four helix bundle protein [Candidatus Nomurabacteria bacterium]